MPRQRPSGRLSFVSAHLSLWLFLASIIPSLSSSFLVFSSFRLLKTSARIDREATKLLVDQRAALDEILKLAKQACEPGDITTSRRLLQLERVVFGAYNN